MQKANKYEYLQVIQGNYGQGWEDIDGTLKLFPNLQAAKDYRHTNGCGGWIFHNDLVVVLFPPDWYPSKIFHHPLLKGHQGTLVGSQ